MSDVVEFLESMGRDARFSGRSQGEFEQAVAAAELETGLKHALLARDGSLEALLGIMPMCSMLIPAEEPEEEEHDEPGHDEDEPGDGQDPERSMLVASGLRD